MVITDARPPTVPPPDAGPPRRRGRWRYRLSVARHEPTLLIGLVLILLLLYLVIAPLVAVLSDAVRVQFGDQPKTGQQPGELTGYYLWRVFRSQVSSIVFWQPLVNTLVVAVGVTVLALLLGGICAFLLTRTNIAGRKWLSTALVVPYMLPSWTFALAWLALFKNDRSGGQVGILEARGVQTPDWLAYGAVPIIVCLGLHYFPFVLLLFGNALRRLDAQLEDSARILGAGRGTVLGRITLPLMLPSLSSSTLLVFGRILGTFGTPYVLGLPVDYTLLSTSLFSAVRNHEPGITAVIATVIVVIGVAVVVADARLLREQRRFVTVGGKGAMDRIIELGRWRWPAGGVALGVFALSVVVPVVTLALTTVTTTPGVFSAENFTLKYWLAEDLPGAPGFPHGILRGTELLDAAWNSLRIVGLASLVCGVVGLLVGYVVVRSDGSRIASVLRQVSFLPYLVPGIAFAAAFLSLFAVRRGPVPALYGSVTLLVIVLAVTHLPYASRSGISAMTQLGREPEEAAQVTGAGWLTRVRAVVVPIQRGSLVTGIVLPFISGIKELSIVIMLTTTGTQLLTTLSINLIDFAYDQMANAVVLVIALVAFLATYLTQRLTRTSLASGLGG
ncbi:binding-protein-dependent transport systems inner membrane component [Kribbella flavida DSM 17836]|uniref:Binding-protein-dependent transport systems inner membrane component n=1 Tax=Kribbella flavida (strain DSM 17836 / JCM 10339 / NBRC 14399) TaxID=479435 RepID=D2PPY0_KRIFD|nr:iron ABC transporter permease [Kribbella flavida]ADB32904.1 binding-protein-dependent transport systems inner membrane component [Kribbella flavida DSM 17836]